MSMQMELIIPEILKEAAFCFLGCHLLVNDIVSIKHTTAVKADSSKQKQKV